MNKERLEAIAAWLEEGAPEKNGVGGFNMQHGAQRAGTECGTVCCIAGAAVYFFAQDNAKRLDNYMINELLNESLEYSVAPFYGPEGIGWIARELLDLSYVESEALFVPMTGIDYTAITPAHAAKVIRSFIKTGDIEWGFYA